MLACSGRGPAGSLIQVFAMPHPVSTIVAVAVTAVALTGARPLLAQTDGPLLQGKAAFDDWHTDRPGTRRLITPADLSVPDPAQSARNFVRSVARTDTQKPNVPTGFEVSLFASGLKSPRLIRVAPNGDVFAAESSAGRIRVLRPVDRRASEATVFAEGLFGPFGIAFYPPGPNPEWVYVGNTEFRRALPLPQR